MKSPTGIGDLIYGFDYYHDDVDSFKNDLNADGSIKNSSIQGPVGDDATYDTFGVYLQDEFFVTERWSFIVGARYEYIEADAGEVQDPVSGKQTSVSGDWDNLAGSLRTLFWLNDEQTHNIYGGVSQGFRAPNLSDLTRLDSARTNEIETPSPDLEPEQYVTYEIGYKVGNEHVSGQIAYYYTDIRDMIIRTPTGRVIDDEFEVKKNNSGEGYVHGFELDGRWTVVPDWTLFGMFSWQDGEIDTFLTSDAMRTTDTFSRLMPLSGRVGLRWEAKPGLWIETAITAADDADNLSARDKGDTSRIPPGGTPGYVEWEARAAWTLTEFATVSLAVENIIDEDFRVHGSGLNEPGRNVIFALDLRL